MIDPMQNPAPKERLPGGWLAIAGPFVWLLGLGAWVMTHRSRLPGWIPVHWALYGPNRWERPTPQAVSALLAAAAVLCVVLTVLAWGTLRSSRWIAPSGPASVAERMFRRRVAGMVLLSEYFLSFTPALSLLPLPSATYLLWTALFWATLVTCVVSLARARRRIRQLSLPQRADLTRQYRADPGWRGPFYYNRRDPSLLVPKRFGIGYTLNFGNPWSWLIMAGPVVIVGLMVRALLG